MKTLKGYVIIIIQGPGSSDSGLFLRIHLKSAYSASNGTF